MTKWIYYILNIAVGLPLVFVAHLSSNLWKAVLRTLDETKIAFESNERYFKRPTRKNHD